MEATQPADLVGSSNSDALRRRGFTVLELLVTCAIAAIALGILLPVVGAARESARRVQCVDHLRQTGIALHCHHDSHGRLPVGWEFDPSQTSAFGWSVALLPFLEETALVERIDRRMPVGSRAHETVRATSLAAFVCPSDLTEPTFLLMAEQESAVSGTLAGGPEVGSRSEGSALVELPTANYVGVFGSLEPDDSIPAPHGDGAFLENVATRYRDFQRGLSSTIVVGERTMAQVPSTWFGVELAGEDAAARLVGAALEGLNNPLADECDFSSRHPGGANFLWADGHVTLVPDEIELTLYHQLARLHP